MTEQETRRDLNEKLQVRLGARQTVSQSAVLFYEVDSSKDWEKLLRPVDETGPYKPWVNYGCGNWYFDGHWYIQRQFLLEDLDNEIAALRKWLTELDRKQKVDWCEEGF